MEVPSLRMVIFKEGKKITNFGEPEGVMPLATWPLFVLSSIFTPSGFISHFCLSQSELLFLVLKLSLRIRLSLPAISVSPSSFFFPSLLSSLFPSCHSISLLSFPHFLAIKHLPA